MSDDAFQVLGDPETRGSFLFTCEHASNALPESVEASAGDQELLDDHWGWDIGARSVTARLVEQLGGQAVVSTFSRLWIDPNRSPDASSLVVSKIDGQPLSFNDAVDNEERQRRTTEYFEPYHQAVDRVGKRRAQVDGPFQLLSVHSFTPLYLGKPRAMEVGVLFNEHDESAWHLEEALIAQGFESALNAPYSGKPPEGLIYAAQRHGRSLGVKYLEIEIRQDLIDSLEKANQVADRVAEALKYYLVLSAERS